LSEAAIIENIAQTCAAGFGYLSSLEVESEPRLGFIGAITKLEVFNELKTNAMIETHVSIINTFENIHLIEGIARSLNIDILKCQMKIVLS
jgi:predicted hotdog family 3-hydroxylacyl-ACP dehydratase